MLQSEITFSIILLYVIESANVSNLSTNNRKEISFTFHFTDDSIRKLLPNVSTQVIYRTRIKISMIKVMLLSLLDIFIGSFLTQAILHVLFILKVPKCEILMSWIFMIFLS